MSVILRGGRFFPRSQVNKQIYPAPLDRPTLCIYDTHEHSTPIDSENITMSWLQTEINETQLRESQCIGFTVELEDYFAVRHQKQLHVFVNRCPHRGVSLEWQENTFLNFEKSLIQCASHGALFTIIDGLCVAGPCQGKSLIKVNHKVVNDQILIEL